MSRSTVGWAGLIFAVYAFNYLWAPLIDRLQIPYLTKKIGHRRGWIVLMQIIILICLVAWSFINPTEYLALLITIGLIIAIASATQDITVDALRIEQIGENENKSMAAGAAIEVIIVLDKVSLIEILVNSKIFISENFLKFSLTRSYMTTVSFIE